jgi:hypothetical protein
LHSTATGAFRFAQWLRDEYRPPRAVVETIRVLLSPTADELGTVPEMDNDLTTKRIHPAQFEAVSAATNAWADCFNGEADDVAIFYAAGHGLQVTTHLSRVLLEDYANSPAFMANSIDLDSLRENMSNVCVRRQFYFADACRTSAQVPLQNYSDDVSASRPLLVRNRVISTQGLAGGIFYSTSHDNHAYESDRGGTCFSCGLLECLRRDAVVQGQNGVVVTISSLIPALQRQVNLRAKEVPAVTQQWPQFYPLGECILEDALHFPEKVDSAPQENDQLTAEERTRLDNATYEQLPGLIRRLLELYNPDAVVVAIENLWEWPKNVCDPTRQARLCYPLRLLRTCRSKKFLESVAQTGKHECVRYAAEKELEWLTS